MKRSLGLHCAILRVNTVPDEKDMRPLGKSAWISAAEELQYLANPTPIPAITVLDMEAMRRFTRELVAQSVVPHMERCISMWNDQVRLLISD
jgi:trafficking protein particle complex subunit 8